jgi:hypothetical protein
MTSSPSCKVYILGPSLHSIDRSISYPSTKITKQTESTSHKAQFKQLNNKMPTGKPNPSDDPESFTEHFNQNADYTRDKSQNQGKEATGSQSEHRQGLRSTTMNPTAESFGQQVGRFF